MVDIKNLKNFIMQQFVTETIKIYQEKVVEWKKIQS
jgi:hypothetical protein